MREIIGWMRWNERNASFGVWVIGRADARGSMTGRTPALSISSVSVTCSGLLLAPSRVPDWNRASAVIIPRALRLLI